MDAALEAKEHPIEQVQDNLINRPIGLSLNGYDPNSGRIQVQVKDLAYLDSTVKFLFTPQQNANDGSIQLITQPHNAQQHQPDEVSLSIANIQADPCPSVAQSGLDCVETALKGTEFGIFVPQEKKDPPTPNESKLMFTDEAQKLKFFNRKLKNIKANIDELQRKAGITAVAMAFYDGTVQFAGPDNMSSLVENKTFRDIFVNSCTKSDLSAMDPSGERRKALKIEKTPALDWPCDECESSFATEHNRINHKLLSHSGLPVHKCEWCDKEFVDITVLQKHLTTHAEDSLFPCKICGNAFSAKNVLNSHMKIHNEDKPYSCKVCFKSFHSSSSLQYHMNKHGNEKKCVCQYCKKEFTKMSSLKVHLRIHTGEQPYRCQECGKGFIVSTHLTRHLRVHSGEKPYLCEVCGKRFNRSSHLRIHFRIHSGEKPYECEICGKKFNQTVSRKKHLKTHMK